MLPLKQGFCPKCNDGKLKSLINGLCQTHYWAERRQDTKAPTRSRRILTPIEQESEALQEQWYQMKVKGMTGWCDECGAIIATWKYRFAKAAVAHILSAELFPSVAVHDLNSLYLGAACGCHTKWDKNWESARNMKVFPVALERFNLFYKDIALAERRRIPAIFFNHLIA